MQETVMSAQDAIYGSLAECYITIDGRRYKFMSMTDFESKWDVTIKEVPILGVVGMGHKAAGGKGTWKGTAHYNQSVIREMGDKYQKTGVMQYFEIQVSVEEVLGGRPLSTGTACATAIPWQSSRQGKTFWTRSFPAPLRAGICRRNSGSLRVLDEEIL